MARIIIYDGREFPDPDPSLSIDEIKQMFASFLPELATAEVKESDRGDDKVYHLVKRVGVKG